jgi:hypothetical protein
MQMFDSVSEPLESTRQPLRHKGLRTDRVKKTTFWLTVATTIFWWKPSVMWRISLVRVSG